jgi:DNA-binding NarL/FixJ family response regulator
VWSPHEKGTRLRAEIPLRVMIAEDSVLLREGLERLLTEAGIEVTGTSDTADKLLSLVANDEPDVAIVDIRLPRHTRTRGCRPRSRSERTTPTLSCWSSLSTWRWGWRYSSWATPRSGPGYLLKDRVSNVKEFVDAVRRVAEGGSAIDPTIV